MGDCRHACCTGWQVSLGMGDYFKLLGIECRKELRDKIDVAIRPVINPTKDKYAYIEHDYEGNCKLRMPDGRCYIQAELGERCLPDICRMYPRAVRKSEVWESSCANSCEAVIEHFLFNSYPITFKYDSYTTDYPDFVTNNGDYKPEAYKANIRKNVIDIMQNRQYSLPKRLIKMGQVLVENERDIREEERCEINAIMTTALTDTIEEKQLNTGIEIMEKYMSYIEVFSPSLKIFGEEASRFFGVADENIDKYYVAKANFEKNIPQYELFLENLLVNHMFFSRFPCGDLNENAFDEFLALCLVYAMLRFLGISCMGKKADLIKLVDVYSAVFRFVDHTDFHKNAAKIMHVFGCTTPERVYSLISL